MDVNNKLEDRNKLIAYLEGKDQVSLKDLIENCGAERLRIYPLLFELTQEKVIQVLKESELGAPELIKLNN